MLALYVVKFSGEEDIREFLRHIEIFVAVNEWSDVKAGEYLAVFLKDNTNCEGILSLTIGHGKEELQRAFTGFEREIRGGLGVVKV